VDIGANMEGRYDRWVQNDKKYLKGVIFRKLGHEQFGFSIKNFNFFLNRKNIIFDRILNFFWKLKTNF
jgi:hypothetical protein